MSRCCLSRMTDISWMQFAKRSGNSTEAIYMFTRVTMRIILKKKHPGWKVKRQVSTKQEIFIEKNWPGCANSQKQEQQKAKAGRIIFTRSKKKPNRELKMRRSNCKQK